MSTVFYRWGAGRDESRVTFDGTHISVFDLKREIILANKMGNGRDFDIGIFDNVTGEEFKDDNHQIPRSSSLIARRLPSSAKGRGNAQNYIVGTSAADALNNEHRIEASARDALREKQLKGVRGATGTYGSMSKRFDGKEDTPAGPSSQHITTGDEEEDKRIQAMLAQSADMWEQTQEEMSMQSRGTGSYRGRPNRPAGGGGSTANKFDFSVAPDREPPKGYLCYRCGKPGHWIQDCPSNDDPAAAERKRFVRVTGIPRSFLQTVETPVGGEGSSGGAMLTADGGFVRAMPDQRQWKVETAKPRTLTNAEVRDQAPLEAELTCGICKKLVWEAVRVPCCDTAFCQEDIETYLLEHDFECPNCESRIASLDKLKPDPELRERVKGYVEGEIARSKDDLAREKAERGETADTAPEGDDRTSEAPEVKIEDDGSAASGNTDDSPAAAPAPEAKPKIKAAPTAPVLDPTKMQEMLNPQTMQIYLTQVHKMLLHPSLTPQARLLLQTQMQMVQATVMQMQVMAASGLLPANNGNTANGGGANGNAMGSNGMGQMDGMGGMGNGTMGTQMGMDMNMNMGMGMPMGMGMGMDAMQMQMMGMGMPFGGGGGGGVNMPNMGNMGGGGGGMNQWGGGGGGGVGRGGYRGRGGFRGRGGGGFRGGFRGGAPKRGADDDFEGRDGDKMQRVA